MTINNDKLFRYRHAAKKEKSGCGKKCATKALIPFIGPGMYTQCLVQCKREWNAQQAALADQDYQPEPGTQPGTEPGTQQPAEQAPAIDKNTLIIGGAILIAAIFTILILKTGKS